MTPKERAQEVLNALVKNPAVFFELWKLLRRRPGVLAVWDRPRAREKWIRKDVRGQTQATVFTRRGPPDGTISYYAMMGEGQVVNPDTMTDTDFPTEEEAKRAVDLLLVEKGWVLA